MICLSQAAFARIVIQSGLESVPFCTTTLHICFETGLAVAGTHDLGGTRSSRLRGQNHLPDVPPEHAVGLDTEAVVAAVMCSASEGGTGTLDQTPKGNGEKPSHAGCPPRPNDPAALLADKGYQSRAVFYAPSMRSQETPESSAQMQRSAQAARGPRSPAGGAH